MDGEFGKFLLTGLQTVKMLKVTAYAHKVCLVMIYIIYLYFYIYSYTVDSELREPAC